jgi:HEAT repeat protein
MLPLEIVPPPRKTVRVGLVIARDIDPAIADEIAALVKTLGDDDWNARESASKDLASLGAVAKSQLESAAKSSDAEVAWRAERLLGAIARPQAAAAQQP